jgi:Domain of unknown function (DUF5134)
VHIAGHVHERAEVCTSAGTGDRQVPRGGMVRRLVPPYRLDRREEVSAIGQLLTTILAAACLGSGLVCLALAAARIGGVASQLTHGVMGLAMAAMLSPWGDPVPAWAGAVAFAVSGAWFASVALAAGRSRAEARHLAIASAAMVVMYLTSTHSADPAASAGGGHAAHGLPGSGGVHGASGVLLVALSLVLAGYFVWHAWTCTERTRTPHAAGPASTVAVRTRTATRVAPVAHGVMSALMAAMFLGVT